MSCLSTLPTVLSSALSPKTRGFILYFCGLRSEKCRQLRVQSVFANGKPVDLKTSGCILRLGSSRDDISRISGDEVTSSWIPVNTSGSLTGIICRFESDAPIFKWVVGIELASDVADISSQVCLRIDCSLPFGSECESKTLRIGQGEGELDVYYRKISPTCSVNDTNVTTVAAHSLSAVGFPLRRVTGDSVSEASLLCVGHRCMGMESESTPIDQRWPENTILSGLKAAELGVPMVEVDVIPLRDSSDAVMYHNFNLVTKMATHKRSCGCCVHEIDLFDIPGICNRTMPNLIPTISEEELENMKWGQHEKGCIVRLGDDVCCVGIGDGQEAIALKRNTKLAEYAPLFSQFLKKVPVSLAVNVELKYPVETPLSAFHLLREEGWTDKSLGGYGNPSKYFYSMNTFADNMIKMLQTQGLGRGVVLSSFNPDLCLVLRQKQSTFPVLFISRAGVVYPNDTAPRHTLDPRHVDAFAAVNWAALVGLDGVVLKGPNIDPELAAHLAKLGLACIQFGEGVSSKEFKKAAAGLGFTGICVDDVDKNLWRK